MVLHTPPLIVISGPTASGKSAVALKLAEQLGGEIVSLDSVQVYRGLDIGSAKPSHSEQEQVRHHLIDIKDPSESFNGAEFLKEAEKAILEISERGKRIIVSGGTTLYLTLLLHGIADLPGSESEIREMLEPKPNDELYLMLTKLDPEFANTCNINDRFRMIRALETITLTGNKASVARESHGYKERRYPAIIIVLCWEREKLYARINSRVEEMVKNGIVGETRKIVESFGDSCQGLLALGYSDVLRLLSGEIKEENLIEEISRRTRHYAKRQMTYWRNEPLKRGWNVFPTPADNVLEIGGENYLKRSNQKEKGFKVYNITYQELSNKLVDRLSSGDLEQEVWYVSAEAL